jgi:hypothetical protein
VVVVVEGLVLQKVLLGRVCCVSCCAVVCWRKKVGSRVGGVQGRFYLVVRVSGRRCNERDDRCLSHDSVRSWKWGQQQEGKRERAAKTKLRVVAVSLRCVHLHIEAFLYDARRCS